MAGLRILIVDDEKAVRSALGRLLSTQTERKVVGEAPMESKPLARQKS